MRSNHFVIRNGKLVSKVDAEKLPQPAPPKLNIIKPTQIIIKRIDEDVKQQKHEDQIAKMKKQYEEAIKKYQQKVKALEKQLQQRNETFEKQIQMRLTDSGKWANGKDSRQTQIFTKGDYLMESCQELFKKCEKLKLEDLESQNIPKQNIGSHDNLMSQNDQKYDRRQSLGSTNQSIYLPVLNILGQNDEKLTSKSCFDSSHFHNSLPILPLSERHDIKQVKNFFDTSTLLDRLNRSASLVKNIKKFLQQPGKQLEQRILIQKSPIIQRAQTEQSQQEIIEENQKQIELQQFIDDLIQKHEQVLQLTQQLQADKQQEIREIRQYYEDIINKMQFEKGCNSHIHYSQSYSRTKHSKISKNGTQNKQNKKKDELQLKFVDVDKSNKAEVKKEKQMNFQRISMKLFISSQSQSQTQGNLKIHEDKICVNKQNEFLLKSQQV